MKIKSVFTNLGHLNNHTKNIICAVMIISGCFIIPILMKITLDKPIPVEPYIPPVIEEPEEEFDPGTAITDVAIELTISKYPNFLVTATRLDRDNHVIYVYINERSNNFNGYIKAQIKAYAKDIATSYDVSPVILLDYLNTRRSVYTYRY